MGFRPRFKKEIPLTDDKGIIKKLEIDGEGAEPQKGEIVKIQFTAKNKKTGRTYDSSDIRGEFLSIEIGKQSGVIRGIRKAVKSMKLGERSEIIIKPDYAFG